MLKQKQKNLFTTSLVVKAESKNSLYCTFTLFFGRGPQTMCLSLPLLDQFQKYAVRDTCSVWLVNRIDRTCDEH